MKKLFLKLLTGIPANTLSADEKEKLQLLLEQNIINTQNNTFSLSGKFKVGFVSSNAKAEYYITPLNVEESIVFIKPEHLNNAKLNDLVVVQRLFGRGSKKEGKVVFITQGEKKSLLVYKHEGTVYALKTHAPLPMLQEVNIEEGHVAKLDAQDNCLVKDYGHINNGLMDEEVSLELYERSYSFSNALLQELEEVSKEPISLGQRKDLRHLNFCTIDPVRAKDFDDAIYFDNEAKKLYVAIADVTHYVRAGTKSHLDAEAYKRGFTVYFPHKSVPMLPRKLSENLCSLNPKVDRYAFVFELQLNNNLEVNEYLLYEGLINSKQRFNYDEIDLVLDGKEHERSDLTQMCEALYDITKQMRAKRLNNGFDFRSYEIDVHLDAEESIQSTHKEVSTASHQLIEECMLLANKAAADMLNEGVFRVHDEPSIQKQENLYNELASLGIRFTVEDSIKKTLKNIMKAVEGNEDEEEIHKLLIRSQMQAKYLDEDRGHFGLGFKSYTHFTSPIRRYSDLVVHTLLKHQLKHKNSLPKQFETKADLYAIALQVSDLEREADDVANHYTKCKYARWAKAQQGKRFKAKIISEDENPRCSLLCDIEGVSAQIMNRNDFFLFQECEVEITHVDLFKLQIFVDAIS